MDRVYVYGIAATMGGLGFLLAWMYLDRGQKRDLYHRRKLRLKREYERKLSELDRVRIASGVTESRKEEDVIILHELQVGEALMMKGNVDEATQHFANAVSVCSHPEKFLRTLKNCLDPTVYHMLLNVLIKGARNIKTLSRCSVNKQI
nr:mitochondrial import receptor subunit TOM20 homolog B-like isoform X2 [Onthophagus taurus]